MSTINDNYIPTIKDTSMKSSLPAANTVYRGGTWPAYGALQPGDLTPAITEQVISKTVLTADSGANAITFSNIPQTYSTLFLYVNTVSTYNVAGVVVTVIYVGTGGILDASANYNTAGLITSGTALTPLEFLGASWVYGGDVTTVSSAGSGVQRSTCFRFTLPHYTNTTFKKMILLDTFADLAGTTGNIKKYFTSTEWNNTGPINIISFQVSGGVFRAGTTVTLTGLP